MPLLQEELLIFGDNLADIGQFVTPKTAVVRERNRFKPEFRITAGVCNVDVRWLSSRETEKEEFGSREPAQPPAQTEFTM